MVKNPPANAGDADVVPWSGRPPRVGLGMDRGQETQVAARTWNVRWVFTCFKVKTGWTQFQMDLSKPVQNFSLKGVKAFLL